MEKHIKIPPDYTADRILKVIVKRLEDCDDLKLPPECRVVRNVKVVTKSLEENCDDPIEQKLKLEEQDPVWPIEQMLVGCVEEDCDKPEQKLTIKEEVCTEYSNHHVETIVDDSSLLMSEHSTIHIGEHFLNNKQTNTEERLFNCYQCPYKSTNKCALRAHVRTHTGERPFSCNQCTYKAKEKGRLLKHMRTHSGEKRFSCDQCPYKTIQRSTLKEHMRIHTGEKPFSCSHCPYKAREKGRLLKHIKTHKGEKPIKDSPP